ncbi:unnamed protein product [Rotaria magnacalcarata]|uniref:MULE transposase domain-containing protein n=1 Tax=Rotaria magnacalcarata TaxID=392030 RepID=A0A819QEC8_9BILA|nr:unnamed protein product [Rotaria magnacalcarata]CAF4027181.1 unnamed protein product [Rotaria magnacalcarata]CAF4828825.1 unnamed protein product [Rotaria magnacalcarata]
MESKLIMMDFELASINAFGVKFVTTTHSSIISGCFFHLQNSIQRKVQGLGFKTNYEQDPVFSHHVNQIAALAFLQPNDVSQGFDDLYNSLPQMLHPLLGYFEDAYVGRNRTQGRAKPMSEIELWNMLSNARLRHLIMHPLPSILQQLEGLAHNL